MSEVVNATASCSSIDGWNVAFFTFSTILYIVALGLFIYLPVRYWKKITWDQNPKNMIIVCLMSSFILGAVDNAITGVNIIERYFGSCRRFDDDEIRSAILGGVYMFFNSLRAVSSIVAIFERGWFVQEKKLVPIFVVFLVITSVVSFLHSVLAYIFIRRSIIKKGVDVVAESKKAGEDYKITKITFTVEQKIRICRCYFLCSCEE
ncbi:hypothetical protein CAEBREN_20997 [Caenorhabditis brenneri]|uniref:Uncharacterized protein n=1 Tax=Caenorhabditis brenneri TaxID=135651 RepID=G0N1T1_CAEBE|nr:hypothetical protein CAEBREN_20997 [Caenorhabditis brenneri]